MFERYTEKARRAVFFARYEASQSGSPEIVPLHLLLGLLRDNSYVFSKAGLRENALEFAKTCRRFLPATGNKISTSVDLPLSNECRQALTHAAAEADLRGSESITPKHLLLGLIKASDEVSGILKDHGLTAESLSVGEPAIEEKQGATAAAPASGVIAPIPGSAFIEFVYQGKQIGNVPLRFSNPVPRVGEEVLFGEDDGAQTFKVLAIKHHFEEPPKSTTRAHAWLAKIVIEVEPSGFNR